MYAIIRSGGKQHRVEAGTTLRVEKLDAEVGKSIQINEVLMVEAEGKITLGDPFIESASVSATVLNQDRAKKIIVFKMKRKKQYRRKQGHRQSYTQLRVDEIKL